MDTSDLLIASLGLQDVQIEKCNYDKENLKAEIWVRQRREFCRCHDCGGALFGTHEWKLKRLRGIALGAFSEVIVYLRQLRAACNDCQKVRQAFAPYIHPRFKRLTTAFAEKAGRLMEETTCEAVARVVRYDSKPLWNLDQWRMKNMKESEMYKDLITGADVSLMSADEVHMLTLRPKKQRWNKQEWEKKFITSLVCYNHSKIIATAAGRDARSLKNCLMQLTEPQRLAVEFMAVDMHDGYIKAATKLCPNAQVAVDRFHLAEQGNNRFDDVRKAELKKAEASKDIFQQGMLAGSRRFVLVEREKDLSRDDKKMLERLREDNKNIHNAMLILEYFHVVLDQKNVKDFRKRLELWYRLVKQSGLKPFKDFAKLVRKYRLRIETYIRSHLTTAVSEGLNNKIKVLKRVGYNYTNDESFQNKILQRAGFLNSTYMDTDSWFFGIGT